MDDNIFVGLFVSEYSIAAQTSTHVFFHKNSDMHGVVKIVCNNKPCIVTIVVAVEVVNIASIHFLVLIN